jgi:uncharacterized protein (UPF0335 family)
MAKPEKDQADRGNVSDGAKRLHSYVTRLERLSEEKKGLSEDIKGVFDEAGSAGFDKKVLRDVVRRRMKDRGEVEEYDALLATYETNLDTILS